MQTEDSTAKYSAEVVAAARAVGAMESSEEVRNPDHLARHFLGPRFRLIRAVPPLRALSFRLWQRAAPGVYHYINARTRHVDRVLLAEAAAGLGQLVILGAGYDTRPYRFAEQLRAVQVFEVDQPATAARKRARLARVSGALPNNVSYVSVDFQRGDLSRHLEAAGYSEKTKTLFLWEGVSYYLTSDAVDGLLHFVSTRSAPDSSIVFDYLYASVLRGPTNYYGADQVRRWLQAHGEPYQSGIDEGRAREFLAARGFELITDLDPKQMEASYLTKRDGSLLGPAFAGYGMAHARVARREEASS
jgi:methyltransferase (TIGR00027 family)